MILDVIKLGMSLLDKVIPDPEQRAKAKLELISLQQEGKFKEVEAAMNVILSESQGESCLQRNWRPVTMLTFVALVVAKWLGLTAPGITEAVELELMRLIQMGLGGYVLGRSVEKGIREWKK